MSVRTRRTPTTRLRLETLEDRRNPSTAYLATDLISDQPGVAAITDPTLVNAWGISLNPSGGAFWVSSNGGNLSEVYGGGVNGNPVTQPFKVAVPGGGAATGQVFANIAGNFVVRGVNPAGAPAAAPSAFLFAGETGAITGWAPGVYAAAGQPAPSRNAVVGYAATDAAVYKGLALANSGGGRFRYRCTGLPHTIPVDHCGDERFGLTTTFRCSTMPDD